MDANLAVEQTAGKLALDTREMRMQLIDYVASEDPDHLQKAHVYLNEVRDGLSSIAADISPGQTQLELPIDSFEQQLLALTKAKPANRRDITSKLIESTTAQLVAPAEKFLLDRQELASETSLQNIAIARRIGHGLLLLGVCGAVAGLLMGLGIARRVHRTLVEISVPVHNIAGQLNEVVGPIQVSSNVALSQLDDSLRMLADKTADVVQRLQESQRETLRHEQLAAVGQLAAGLAHELRNPLMSVKLIVQTAAERDNGSLNKRDLAVMEDELLRLEKMLQSFLDFARPPRLNLSPIQLATFLSKTVDVIRIRAEQQDVRLHLDLPLAMKLNFAKYY
jgi:signal transduction histidine kinase